MTLKRRKILEEERRKLIMIMLTKKVSKSPVFLNHEISIPSKRSSSKSNDSNNKKSDYGGTEENTDAELDRILGAS
jgi:hypothetical protein